MLHYLKFGILNWIVVFGTTASFIVGGAWMWFGVCFMFIVGVGGELISRDDYSEPEYKYNWLHDLNAYIIAFGLLVALAALIWMSSASDLLGIGAHINSLWGIDVLANKSLNGWYDQLGAALSLGIILGVQGIVVSHELTHRTDRPFDMFVGRWVFGLMYGTNFATEHVHGHHKNLGFPEIDPVSVKRGTGFYTFLTKGTYHQWLNGIDIERERLNDNGKSVWNWDNQVLRAYLRGALVGIVVIVLSGWLGLVLWSVALFFAKYILEGLNYFSHYGMVREKDQPITIRHTYSNNNLIGNMFLLNLGRHGAHHAYGGDYQNFKACPDQPQSPYGYITMTVLSWIPPLFRKVMIPVVQNWDEKYATEGELKIATQHNKESGIDELKKFKPNKTAQLV